ncbi:MAG: acyl-CoA dehydrogenase family protein [Myxococcota bacterium]
MTEGKKVQTSRPALVLSEDQELLAKTTADFVAKKSPIRRVRELRDSGDPDGFSRALWKEMAELGWVGIPFPEEVGGADMGLSELAVVLEALGRQLAPEPFLSTVLLGGQALLLGGSDGQKAEWLPKLTAGEVLLALAYQEKGSRYDAHCVTSRAVADGDGWKLAGEKIQVLEGGSADAIVVAARTSGGDTDPEGISLFLVTPDTPGVTLTRQHRIDSRGAAIVALADVAVGAGALVGTLDGGGAILDRVLRLATVGLCAEMLGSMSEVFDRTLQYLKDRVQFGVPIGSFQALKHRAAELFIQIELSRSAVMAAARAEDAGADDAPLLVSVAKARCSDAGILVAHESIQMHGGIGMTDEHDMGFYLKRARTAEFTFGDASWHRERWATLSGY